MDLAGSTWEDYWHRHRAFLERAGYRLRPKFGPNFATHVDDLSETALDDYTTHYFHEYIMDAVRIADGQKVMLKYVSTKDNPDEVNIALLFCSPPHAGSPSNHCVPIYQVLQDPDDDDIQILVMPFLVPFYRPKFDTVGEAIDCFRQVFEGIQYMHNNFVAHRDCGINNILQDGAELYPAGVHPVRPWLDPSFENYARPIKRTECWPRYYIIDFGLSRRYDPKDGLPFEDTIRGGDKSAPEYNYFACNPFPTDIYVLGNLLKTQFLYSTHRSEREWAPLEHKSWRFLKPLIRDMTLRDPVTRPTIGEVIERFDGLCRKLSSRHLRRSAQRGYGLSMSTRWFRQFKRMITRVPPLPPYSPPPVVRLSQEMRAFYTQTDKPLVLLPRA
ncbi:kinase-like domain-containing protein [Mycena vitilis]|nr:kinase-like domain-containing protein [Mycena vitilis]